MSKGKIFISYRHIDEAYAGRLRLQIAARFGNHHVFRDIDDSAWHHVSELRDVVASCQATICVIGPGFHERTSDLANSNDPLRVEIEEALKKPGNALFPVLVGQAQMPQPDVLPPALHELANHRADNIYPEFWDEAVERLLDRLETRLTGSAGGSAERCKRSNSSEEEEQVSVDGGSAQQAVPAPRRPRAASDGNKLPASARLPGTPESTADDVPRRFGSTLASMQPTDWLRYHRYLLAFSADGTRLATVHPFGRVTVWAVEAAAKTTDFYVKGDGVSCVAYHPSAHRLATGGSDGVGRIFDIDTGKELARRKLGGLLAIFPDLRRTYGIAFSTDGSLVATCNGNGAMRVLNSENCSLLWRIKPSHDISKVAFSADDSRIACTGYSGATGVYEVKDGTEVLKMPGCDDGTGALVTFVPGGFWRVLRRTGGQLVVHDVETGVVIAELPGAGGLPSDEPYTSVFALSPCGSRLFTGHKDGCVRMWGLPAGKLLDETHPKIGEIAKIAHCMAARRLAVSGDEDTVVVLELTE